MKKKIITLMLMACMISFAACGDNDTKVTQQPNSGGKIVFLPDDSIELGEFRIGEKYQALFDWQEVIEYVRLCNLESIEYVNKTKLNKSPKIPKNITKQQGNLLQQIMIKAMQKNLIDVSLLKKK